MYINVALVEGQTMRGLLLRDGPRITLTPEGRRLCRVVASVFDAWLAASEARHSVAV